MSQLEGALPNRDGRIRKMHVVDLNLRQMAYVIEVLDRGHFGRAAEALFISAPALTQQVRSLERRLGVELIDRTRHPLQPTAEGARFLIEARAVVTAAERALAAVTTKQTNVRIGFMTAAIDTATYGLIEQMRKTHDNYTFELVELAWSDQAPAVQRGAVDAAIMRPPISDDTGLQLDVIFVENRVVALPLRHRLAGRDSVSVTDLDDDRHVDALDVDPEWVRWWACDPRPSGQPVRYGPSVRTIDEVLEAVAAGDSVAITSAMVPDTHRHPLVTFVRVRDAEPSPVCLCTREGDANPAVAALRKAARDMRMRAGASSGGTARE